MPLLLTLCALAAAEDAPAGKGYALLVGVNRYDHAALNPLGHAENDVLELAKLLDRPGSPFAGRVRVLTTGAKTPAGRPTAANVRQALKELTTDRTRDDTVLVALAGHGIEHAVAPPPGKKGETRTFPFFCPADAQFDTDYETGHNPRLLSVTGLMDQLGGCGAGGKLLLVDACRNQLAPRAAVRALSVERGMVPGGVAAMFGCKAGKSAYESDDLKHGVFFHFVLQGLRGGAKGADGRVTWGLLTNYVLDAMAAEAKGLVGREQTPELVVRVSTNPLLHRDVRAVPREVEFSAPEATPGARGVTVWRAVTHRAHVADGGGGKPGPLTADEKKMLARMQAGVKEREGRVLIARLFEEQPPVARRLMFDRWSERKGFAPAGAK
ncbi:MAG: caspase family protein [Gemmataceae bacterium]